jgi:hypothetical protein
LLCDHRMCCRGLPISASENGSPYPSCLHLVVLQQPKCTRLKDSGQAGCKMIDISSRSHFIMIPDKYYSSAKKHRLIKINCCWSLLLIFRCVIKSAI